MGRYSSDMRHLPYLFTAKKSVSIMQAKCIIPASITTCMYWISLSFNLLGHWETTDHRVAISQSQGAEWCSLYCSSQGSSLGGGWTIDILSECWESRVWSMLHYTTNYFVQFVALIWYYDIVWLLLQGSRFLNVEHFPPEQITPLGDVVAVSAKGSSVFVFDTESTNFIKTFDVYPMTRHLVTG